MVKKYDIRKATGRKSVHSCSSDRTVHDEDRNFSVEPESVNLQKRPSENLDKSIEDQFRLFESIVSHNYLTRLSYCPIVAPSNEHLSNMGWYKITRIVLDGNTFFPDQLSMLYTALHDVAQTIALVVDK